MLKILATLLLLLLAALPATTTRAAAADATSAPTSATAASATATNPATSSALPVRVGVDYYSGLSNRNDARRFSDGFWAGSAAAYPSVGYLRWENANGAAAKLSVGVGRMYAGASDALDQPVEAWYRSPAGRDVSVTLGKFWVPFAAQEWQYETKPGVMLQWARGSYNAAISANHNKATRTANVYTRLGRTFGETAAVGVSLGMGRGLSYDTGHDRAWGLDGSVAVRGFRLSGEYVGLRHPEAAGEFYFAYGKLAYEAGGAWQPFVARYVWNDKSEELGAFRSTTFGLGYQIRPGLVIEGAHAITSEKNVNWLQLHWTWER